MAEPGKRHKPAKVTLGWREWLAMPELGVDGIIAKVDTGAKTCALHAFYIEPFEQDGEDWIRFGLHPNRHKDSPQVHCQARIKETRDVTDSGGHTENRYVIETVLEVGDEHFPAEVTLTNRDTMKYRFLLGRNALRRRFVVDPARSWRLGRREEP